MVPESVQLDCAVPVNFGLTSRAVYARPCTVTPGVVGLSVLHCLPASSFARPHTSRVTPGKPSLSSSRALPQSLTHLASHMFEWPMSAAFASQPILLGSHFGSMSPDFVEPAVTANSSSATMAPAFVSESDPPEAGGVSVG